MGKGDTCTNYKRQTRVGKDDGVRVNPIGIGRSFANISSRVAQRVVAERFKPDSKDRPDMLGSFLRHGLTKPQAEAESLIQMYGKHLVFIYLQFQLFLFDFWTLIKCYRMAGSDSTATAIRVILYYIVATPK